jgi:CDP-diacylglycerol---serine O-phosphatidyltransferase
MIMKQIPNFFTLLNLCLGCTAILYTLQTGETILNLDGLEWKLYIPEKITWAALCIFGAAVVDFLDGFVARLLKADSEMGKQLDSLSDVVSFGVAPGMILFQLLRLAFAAEPSGLETSLVWMAPALLIPLAAAWRLARFNIAPSHSEHFTGLPVPAAGLLIASLPLIALYNTLGAQSLLINPWILYGIIIFLSAMMVSRIPLMSLKFKHYGFSENLPRYILLLSAVPSILLLGWLSAPALLIVYILVSLLFKNRLK